MKTTLSQRGAAFTETALAILILLPIFILFGTILLNSASSLSDRTAGPAYNVSPCELSKAPEEWCK